MTEVLRWTLSASVLILAALLLRSLLGKKLRPGLRYGLWGLVLLRLLIPGTLFQFPWSLSAGLDRVGETETARTVQQAAERDIPRMSYEDALAETVAEHWENTNPAAGAAQSAAGTDAAPSGGQPVTAVPPMTEPAAEPAPAETMPETTAQREEYVASLPRAQQTALETETRDRMRSGVSIEDILLWVWIGGMAVTALAFLLANTILYLKLVNVRQPVGADCPIPVYQAEGLSSSCLFFRAVYVTPDTAGDPEALSCVLAHELAHRRHGDGFWPILRCAALVLHWYNPLVWLAAAVSRQDGELFADAGALRVLGDDRRQTYGETLIRLSERRDRSSLLHTATTMTGDKFSLRERILLIAKRPKTLAIAAVAVLLVLALVLVLVFASSGGSRRIRGWSFSVSSWPQVYDDWNAQKQLTGPLADKEHIPRRDLSQFGKRATLSVLSVSREDRDLTMQVRLKTPGVNEELTLSGCLEGDWVYREDRVRGEGDVYATVTRSFLTAIYGADLTADREGYTVLFLGLYQDCSSIGGGHSHVYNRSLGDTKAYMLLVLVTPAGELAIFEAPLTGDLQAVTVQEQNGGGVYYTDWARLVMGAPEQATTPGDPDSVLSPLTFSDGGRPYRKPDREFDAGTYFTGGPAYTRVKRRYQDCETVLGCAVTPEGYPVWLFRDDEGEVCASVGGTDPTDSRFETWSFFEHDSAYTESWTLRLAPDVFGTTLAVITWEYVSEIAAPQTCYALYALDETGRPMTFIPYSAKDRVGEPVLCDLDGDGRAELAILADGFAGMYYQRDGSVCYTEVSGLFTEEYGLARVEEASLDRDRGCFVLQGVRKETDARGDAVWGDLRRRVWFDGEKLLFYYDPVVPEGETAFDLAARQESYDLLNTVAVAEEWRFASIGKAWTRAYAQAQMDLSASGAEDFRILSGTVSSVAPGDGSKFVYYFTYAAKARPEDPTRWMAASWQEGAGELEGYQTGGGWVLLSRCEDGLWRCTDHGWLLEAGDIKVRDLPEWELEFSCDALSVFSEKETDGSDYRQVAAAWLENWRQHILSLPEDDPAAAAEVEIVSYSIEYDHGDTSQLAVGAELRITPRTLAGMRYWGMKSALYDKIKTVNSSLSFYLICINSGDIWHCVRWGRSMDADYSLTRPDSTDTYHYYDPVPGKASLLLEWEGETDPTLLSEEGAAALKEYLILRAEELTDPNGTQSALAKWGLRLGTKAELDYKARANRSLETLAQMQADFKRVESSCSVQSVVLDGAEAYIRLKETFTVTYRIRGVYRDEKMSWSQLHTVVLFNGDWVSVLADYYEELVPRQFSDSETASLTRDYTAFLEARPVTEEAVSRAEEDLRRELASKLAGRDHDLWGDDFRSDQVPEVLDRYLTVRYLPDENAAAVIAALQSSQYYRLPFDQYREVFAIRWDLSWTDETTGETVMPLGTPCWRIVFRAPDDSVEVIDVRLPQAAQSRQDGL